MAIEYGLQLDGSAAEHEVAETLSDTAVAAGLTGSPRLAEARLDSGLLVVTSTRRPLPFPDPVEEEFGFVSCVSVLFRVDKFTDGARQRRDMVRLVVAVLTATSADALLNFNGEITWLLRRAGRLEVRDRADLWTPELLDLLPQPFERVDLPDL